MANKQNKHHRCDCHHRRSPLTNLTNYLREKNSHCSYRDWNKYIASNESILHGFTSADSEDSLTAFGFDGNVFDVGFKKKSRDK